MGTQLSAEQWLQSIWAALTRLEVALPQGIPAPIVNVAPTPIDMSPVAKAIGELMKTQGGYPDGAALLKALSERSETLPDNQVLDLLRKIEASLRRMEPTRSYGAYGAHDVTIGATSPQLALESTAANLLTNSQLRATPIKVESAAGLFTDRSGTITAGGTAQTLASANTSRKYLLIQNVSAGDLWINFTTAAIAGQPSFKLASGDSFVQEGTFVSTEAISIFGATSGQAFSAKEG